MYLLLYDFAMAMRIHLGKLLGERKMKVSELSRATGITPHPLADIYHEKVTQIRLDTLEKLCEILDCSVGELIEYVPDKKTEGTIRTEEK
jgi:putative transcriptional regulator